MFGRVRNLLAIAVVVTGYGSALAADPFPKVAVEVNEKTVKIFGSGGFRGVTNYSTGIVISPDGHILTVASQTLDTSELILHLYDGRRMKAVVLVTEPVLDAAILKIKAEDKKPEDTVGLNLPFFDMKAAMARPNAEAGDWILAFSNQYEVAMRNEPLSVQRGTIMSYSKLRGRRGIFDFPYDGEVYVVDAITNGPGAGGGPVTDRKGNLLGIIGREIKNSLSETWINYAVPVNAKLEIQEGDKKRIVSMAEFLDKGPKGTYVAVQRAPKSDGPGGFHGIKFVPNVLERTPPYVDELIANSPAVKAGVKVNDLVSFIDGEPIYSIRAFADYMRRTRPGMTVRLEVRRGDNLVSIELQLGEFPKGLEPPKPVEPKKP
jgi:serine protease Do